MSEKDTRVLAHIIYRWITVLWWLLIALYFYLWYNKAVQYKTIEKYNKMEATDFVEYIAVEPTKEVFEMGEPIYLRSNRNVKISVPLSFIDILFCDFGEGRKRVWQFNSDSPNPKRTSGRSQGRILPIEVPQKPATCCVESTIISNVYPWAKLKYQYIKSPTFRVE